METGKKYKLTDKCITPGGRNMTRDEDVIIEAKKYYRNDIKCYDAFLHGVEWVEEQIANLWHDASDNPTKDTLILYRTTSGECGITELACTSEGVWHLFVNNYEVAEWAYISDLLPKGGEL